MQAQLSCGANGGSAAADSNPRRRGRLAAFDRLDAHSVFIRGSGRECGQQTHGCHHNVATCVFAVFTGYNDSQCPRVVWSKKKIFILRNGQSARPLPRDFARRLRSRRTQDGTKMMSCRTVLACSSRNLQFGSLDYSVLTLPKTEVPPPWWSINILEVVLFTHLLGCFFLFQRFVNKTLATTVAMKPWKILVATGIVFILHVQFRSMDDNALRVVTLTEPPLVPNNLADQGIKMIAISNYKYHKVALAWYDRLQELGYTEQVIVATDRNTIDFLNSNTTTRRKFEEWLTPPLSAEEKKLPMQAQRRNEEHKMFAWRWHYILKQLRQGVSILMTDVDNIFSSYVPLSSFMDWDVIYAYATPWPPETFKKLGYSVCGGMVWLQATSRTICGNDYRKVWHVR